MHLAGDGIQRVKAARIVGARLVVAIQSHDLVVEDRHLEEAFKELVFEGGELAKRLLGASRAF